MDWLDRMNGAIGYIEANLAGEIDYEHIARIACCSTYHFQRMFSFIADVSLSEYIRRRRLTLAAFELQNSSVRIIDLALRYGYDSPVSFTRAFQKLHGVAPSSAREDGVQLKAYPRMAFHLSLRGDKEMNYRIEQKQAFSVFGIEKVFSLVDEANLRDIPQFWVDEMDNGGVERISRAGAEGASADGKATAAGACVPVHAVMNHRDAGPQLLPYMLCAFTPASGVPQGFDSADIPAMTWAIFSTDRHTADQTSQQVQGLWKRIFTEWFPTSGYEALNAAQFEMYYGEQESSYCEIWIPIATK